MTDLPLRVLDLTDGLALMAGRLLIGTGADVVRVETTTDPVPTPADRLHWHAGKRVVRVDPAEVAGTVGELLRQADVVVESGPVDRLRTLSLRDTDPGLWAHVAHVVVTPFGLTGPRARWTADDAVAAAAGGMAWLGGDPDGEPTPPPRGQATQVAGAHAAIAALLAVIARRRTGRGQLVEISVQEAVAATLETGAISWIHGGTVPGRTSGVYAHVAHRVFPCGDGHVAGGYSGPNRMWDDLLSWMEETGEAEDLTDEVWQDPVHRWRNREHVDAVVRAFCQRRHAADIGTQGRERALPWAAVARPGELLDNPQLAHRRFLVDVLTPAGAVRDVGFPYESPALPRPVRLPGPEQVDRRVAWHRRTASDDTRVSDQSWEARGPSRRGEGALAGLRVLDLTWVLAGPYVTRTLADHGADTIKVESRHRQDPTRFAPSMRLRPGAGPDESGYFINFNRNKRSLALNLRSDAGPPLLRRLAAEVDVVVENFSPGTLEKWGLGWNELRSINPGVVLVSMAGVGATGPWRNAVTFADTLAAMSGLTHETGVDGRDPQGLTFGLGDMVAANAATLATLEHLLRGGGAHVDLSQLEAMAAHLGTALLNATLPAEEAADRNRPRMLRVAGTDRWVAVGATSRERLAVAVEELTGQPVDDPTAALEQVASGWDADELAAALQARGIAAYPVRDGRDLVTLDPQLTARRFYPTQHHPLVGDVQVEGVVAHLSDTPPGLRSPAPLLGEHTDEVLEEILGLDHHQVRQLRDQGALE